MKILVFSDTHGNPAFMFHAVKEHLAHGPVDLLLHLGDGWRDFEALRRMYPTIPSHAVCGNCDFPTPGLPPEQQILSFEGICFFLTHGHIYHVKRDILNAASAAAKAKATVLLYGHTHLACDHREDTLFGTVRCINPGSAGAGYNPSYACLELVPTPHSVSPQLLVGFGRK